MNIKQVMVSLFYLKLLNLYFDISCYYFYSLYIWSTYNIEIFVQDIKLPNTFQIQPN